MTGSTRTEPPARQQDGPAGTVIRFNRAINRHDVDAAMSLMSADCVFESTAAPDGRRLVGADAVRAAWQDLFASSPGARFTTEELIVAGDRVVVRWRYDWTDRGSGAPGHVRGIDLFRVTDGLIREKLSYVKG